MGVIIKQTHLKKTADVSAEPAGKFGVRLSVRQRERCPLYA